MTFTVNKADWVNEWSIQYTAIRNNTPDILNKLRSIKRITDYTGGEKYIFRDYDNNQGTMNDVNLNERNRQFQWQAFDRGGRQFSRIRVNYPVLVDTEQEVKNTLSSPKEDILRTIQNKFLKRRNKAISDAVIADAQIIQADGTVSAVSSSNDGVITTDLTSGTFDKNTFINIRNKFVANEVVDASLYDLGGDVIVSQAEMSEIIKDQSLDLGQTSQFLADDFKSGATRNMFYGFQVLEVAGNDSTDPDISVNTPMLTEATQKRNCLALAPNALAYWEGELTIDLLTPHEMRSNGYDDSFGIFFAVDFILGRTKGNRVQVIQTAL